MITLRQSPTSPNIANNRLIYAVSSDNTTQPQFQYVLDINDANGNLLQRLKQQPNPNGYGVFNTGPILTQFMEGDDNIWDCIEPTPNTSSATQFEIRLGEEFAQSTTSQPQLYTGYIDGIFDQAGDPQVSGSQEYFFAIDGAYNFNQNGWNFTDKVDYENPLDDVVFSHQNGLTNFNTSSIRIGDAHTISFLHGRLDGDDDLDSPGAFAQDVYAVRIVQYDASNIRIQDDVIPNLAFRIDPSETWDQAWGRGQNQNTRLIHFPVGPSNLEGAGITINDNAVYYVASFHPQATDRTASDIATWGEYRFNIDRECSPFDGVRFIWKNQYGVWDYFNFTLANKATTSIERKEYESSVVNFGQTPPLVWDNENRGATNYNNKITTKITAESNYLTDAEAQNVKELFYSTNVYVQDGGMFYPVVIDSADYVEKTNPLSQKLFRYSVEYRYANQPQSRV